MRGLRGGECSLVSGYRVVEGLGFGDKALPFRLDSGASGVERPDLGQLDRQIVDAS